MDQSSLEAIVLYSSFCVVSAYTLQKRPLERGQYEALTGKIRSKSLFLIGERRPV